MPNIDGADVTSVSDKVDLTIVPESTNTTKFAAIDCRKHEIEEVSDSDAKLYHTASETVVSPTDSSTEAIILTNNSTTFDGGSPSPSSQTAVSAVRINYPCSVQTENTKDSEVYDGHIDLCTSLDHTKNTLSSESSHSVTSNEVNFMTFLSGPSKGDNNMQH